MFHNIHFLGILLLLSHGHGTLTSRGRHDLVSRDGQDYHQQYLAKPRARPYCLLTPMFVHGQKCWKTGLNNKCQKGAVSFCRVEKRRTLRPYRCWKHICGITVPTIELLYTPLYSLVDQYGP